MRSNTPNQDTCRHYSYSSYSVFYKKTKSQCCAATLVVKFRGTIDASCGCCVSKDTQCSQSGALSCGSFTIALSRMLPLPTGMLSERSITHELSGSHDALPPIFKMFSVKQAAAHHLERCLVTPTTRSPTYLQMLPNTNYLVVKWLLLDILMHCSSKSSSMVVLTIQENH
jgi:hypothetical protein